MFSEQNWDSAANCGDQNRDLKCWRLKCGTSFVGIIVPALWVCLFFSFFSPPLVENREGNRTFWQVLSTSGLQSALEGVPCRLLCWASRPWWGYIKIHSTSLVSVVTFAYKCTYLLGKCIGNWMMQYSFEILCVCCSCTCCILWTESQKCKTIGVTEM